MAEKNISVNVRLHEKEFRRFSAFDTFVRKKGWRRPLVLLLVMIAVAVAFMCTPGGLITGCVLLGIGLLMPLAYVWSFFSVLKSQVGGYHLAQGRRLYRVTFVPDAEFFTASSDDATKVEYPWASCTDAYRVDGGCTYLYVNAKTAILLPDDCIENSDGDTLWALLGEHLTAEHMHDRRKAA